MAEIKSNEVYTTAEAQELLKVSNSTIKRLLKQGLIRANKVGGQYRILGHELLALVSPEFDKGATTAYRRIKKTIQQRTRDW